MLRKTLITLMAIAAGASSKFCLLALVLFGPRATRRTRSEGRSPQGASKFKRRHIGQTVASPTLPRNLVRSVCNCCGANAVETRPQNINLASAASHFSAVYFHFGFGF
jgi:hypothetical protein